MAKEITPEKREAKKKILKWEYCDKGYANKANLRQHLVNAHGQNQYKVHLCAKCGEKFANRSHRDQHESVGKK